MSVSCWFASLYPFSLALLVLYIEAELSASVRTPPPFKDQGADAAAKMQTQTVNFFNFLKVLFLLVQNQVTSPMSSGQ